jgi:hypothetical protein
MPINFNQALEAWQVAAIHVLRRLQVPSHWHSDYRSPGFPIDLRHRLLLTERFNSPIVQIRVNFQALNNVNPS